MCVMKIVVILLLKNTVPTDVAYIMIVIGCFENNFINLIVTMYYKYIMYILVWNKDQ